MSRMKMMRNKLERLTYVLSTGILMFLTALYVLVLVTSVARNLIDMCVRVGWSLSANGNYLGLVAGFVSYFVYVILLVILRVRHNLDWFMKFTHELTHALVAVLFFAKIREFVVKDRECYVSYKAGPVGYVPITLSPYCIPIYTIMLFPFRFAGDSSYMIIFDVLIAFTYAFHLHSFIRQTRFTQSDIQGCGLTRSVAFISFVHLAVLSLILAIPKGGVLNALSRVFWQYPVEILTEPSKWFHQIIKFF
ncbi:MAG: hypothetical protein IJB05_05465 [Bacteroidales bacterium]|nr:hypothetical protein [Bacteroidales bacterium]